MSCADFRRTLPKKLKLLSSSHSWSLKDLPTGAKLPWWSLLGTVKSPRQTFPNSKIVEKKKKPMIFSFQITTFWWHLLCRLDHSKMNPKRGVGRVEKLDLNILPLWLDIHFGLKRSFHVTLISINFIYIFIKLFLLSLQRLNRVLTWIILWCSIFSTHNKWENVFTLIL